MLGALPKSAHPGAKRALAEIWNAEDREHARRAVAAFKHAYGGKFGKAGDYLYTTYLADQASLGAWGIFRVGPPQPMTPPLNAVCHKGPAPVTVVPSPSGPAPARTDMQDLQKRFHRPPSNPGSGGRQ